MKRYIRKLKCMICTINFPLLPPDMSCQKPRTNTDTDGSLRASVLESKESVLATFFANLSSVIHFCELLNNIISLPSFFRNYDRISDAAGSRWARMNIVSRPQTNFICRGCWALDFKEIGYNIQNKY